MKTEVNFVKLAFPQFGQVLGRTPAGNGMWLELEQQGIQGLISTF